MKGGLEKKIEEITGVKDVKLSTLKSNGIFLFNYAWLNLCFRMWWKGVYLSLLKLLKNPLPYTVNIYFCYLVVIYLVHYNCKPIKLPETDNPKYKHSCQSCCFKCVCVYVRVRVCTYNKYIIPLTPFRGHDWWASHVISCLVAICRMLGMN